MHLAVSLSATLGRIKREKKGFRARYELLSTLGR